MALYVHSVNLIYWKLHPYTVFLIESELPVIFTWWKNSFRLVYIFIIFTISGGHLTQLTRKVPTKSYKRVIFNSVVKLDLKIKPLKYCNSQTPFRINLKCLHFLEDFLDDAHFLIFLRLGNYRLRNGFFHAYAHLTLKIRIVWASYLIYISRKWWF